MIKTTTTLLGAGLLAATLGLPLTASAHENDGLSFVVGAALGQALADEHHGTHYVYRRQYDLVPTWQRWQMQRRYDELRHRHEAHERFLWEHGQRNFAGHDRHGEHRDRDWRYDRDHRRGGHHRHMAITSTMAITTAATAAITTVAVADRRFRVQAAPSGAAVSARRARSTRSTKPAIRASACSVSGRSGPNACHTCTIPCQVSSSAGLPAARALLT